MLRRYVVALCVVMTLPFMISCLGAISVGYLKTQPDIDMTRKKFQYPLHIVLGNKIQDSFTITGSVKDIKVTEYRKTLEDLLKSIFENNYREVSVSGMEQNRGVELVFSRFEPYQVQASDGIKIGMRLYAEILKDGVPKGEIRGEDVGEFKAVTIFQIDKSMDSALQKMSRGLYDQYIRLANQLQM